jgi:hypothetical protein
MGQRERVRERAISADGWGPLLEREWGARTRRKGADRMAPPGRRRGSEGASARGQRERCRQAGPTMQREGERACVGAQAGPSWAGRRGWAENGFSFFF